MWLAENEAVEKWCPLASGENGRNRIAEGPNKDSFCLASKCMAWRSRGMGDERGKGYCGLMEKPE